MADVRAAYVAASSGRAASLVLLLLPHGWTAGIVCDDVDHARSLAGEVKRGKKKGQGNRRALVAASRKRSTRQRSFPFS
jgi:hypothetical protein